jgi:hypothetical protein
MDVRVRLVRLRGPRWQSTLRPPRRRLVIQMPRSRETAGSPRSRSGQVCRARGGHPTGPTHRRRRIFLRHRAHAARPSTPRSGSSACRLTPTRPSWASTAPGRSSTCGASAIASRYAEGELARWVEDVASGGVVRLVIARPGRPPDVRIGAAGRPAVGVDGDEVDDRFSVRAAGGVAVCARSTKRSRSAATGCWNAPRRTPMTPRARRPPVASCYGAVARARASASRGRVCIRHARTGRFSVHSPRGLRRACRRCLCRAVVRQVDACRATELAGRLEGPTRDREARIGSSS